MNFRYDINGLRAIAVIGVILFHYNIGYIPGGFAGVDVFFVISGYLMTAIIFKGFKEKSFSLLRFYNSRANRIIPPLAVLSLVLLIFGWLYLSPLDYKVLSKHIMSSLGFVSNIVYWRESGYFDAASYEKWLLHTWSLSVEWQFYLIYPVVLLFLRKIISYSKIKMFILISVCISFTLSIYASNNWPIAAYYLLITRGWELLFGSLAYMYPIVLKSKNGKILNWLGLILILLSYLLISKNNIWPGYLAFLPVFGTYLVIISNQQNSIITNNFIFQKLGKWSYSIYLWHWPILVYSYYFPMKNWYLIGIPLSVLLGWISFRVVESYRLPRFKYWYEIFFRKQLWFYISVGIVTLGIYLSKGVTGRYPKKDSILIEELSSKIVMPHRGNGFCFYSFYDDKTLKVDTVQGKNCFLGKTADRKEVDTLLFGDSFAGTYDPFWSEIFNTLGKPYQSVSTNWCTPSFTENFTGPKSNIAYEQCLLNRDFLKKSISNETYSKIIFASNWNSLYQQDNIDDFLEVVSEANKHNIKIFIIATPMSYIRNPITLFIRNLYAHQPFDLSKYERDYKYNNYANDILRDKLRLYSNAYFIDREMMFSKNSMFKYKEFNVPYTLDGNHVSKVGSINAAKYFMSTPQYITVSKELKK